MEQLIPGVYAVARGRDRLQVGFGDRRAVVSRTPEDAALLDGLAGGPVRLPTHSATARLLRSRGLVAPAPIPDGLARRLAAEAPGSWQARLEARRGAGVRVIGELDVDPRPLLDDCGFGANPTVALVLGRGGPDPDRVDALMRSDVPHLAVTCTDGSVTLGPFVQPGATACTTCLLMHETGEDPELPEVARRYREAARHDPAPPPDNRVLLTLALAWAVRDLTAFIDGAHPTTWSSTIRLDPAGPPVVTSWLRHPECGCSWTSAAG